MTTETTAPAQLQALAKAVAATVDGTMVELKKALSLPDADDAALVKARDEAIVAAAAAIEHAFGLGLHNGAVAKSEHDFTMTKTERLASVLDSVEVLSGESLLSKSGEGLASDLALWRAHGVALLAKAAKQDEKDDEEEEAEDGVDDDEAAEGDTATEPEKAKKKAEKCAKKAEMYGELLKFFDEAKHPRDGAGRWSSSEAVGKWADKNGYSRSEVSHGMRHARDVYNEHAGKDAAPEEQDAAHAKAADAFHNHMKFTDPKYAADAKTAADKFGFARRSAKYAVAAALTGIATAAGPLAHAAMIPGLAIAGHAVKDYSRQVNARVRIGSNPAVKKFEDALLSIKAQAGAIATSAMQKSEDPVPALTVATAVDALVKALQTMPVQPDFSPAMVEAQALNKAGRTFSAANLARFQALQQRLKEIDREICDMTGIGGSDTDGEGVPGGEGIGTDTNLVTKGEDLTPAGRTALLKSFAK